MNCQIDIIDTIHKIGAHEWNDATRGPFFSHEWFRFVETIAEFDLQPHYLTCRQEGRLIAALPAFAPQNQHNTYASYLLGRYKEKLLRLPSFRCRPLVCYAPLAGGKYLMSDNPIGGGSLKDIVFALEDAAFRGGYSEIVFLYIKAMDTEWTKLLDCLAYQRVYLNSVGVIENHFGDFESYLKGLSRRQRKAVKSDLQAFRKSGYSIDERGVSTRELEAMMRLVGNIDRRYPSTRWNYTKSFLSACFDHMQTYLKNYVVSTGDGPIGCLSLFEKDRLINTYALGLDFAKIHASRTYFNLLYYHSIREMIARQAPYINFNQMAYKVKESRGCRLVPQYMYVKVLRGRWWMSLWLRLLNFQYRRKFTTEYGRNLTKHRRRSDGR
jgi:predicted N-acyltransferase